MPSTKMARVLAITAVGFLALAGDALRAQPARPNVPPSGQLSAAARAQIDRRIGYWLERLADADSQADIRSARDELVADYTASGNHNYHYTYANSLALQAPKALEGLEDSLRQINLALAVSEIDHVKIQPVLDVMVAHANPAVRYLGWEGYREIRSLAMAQGPSYAEQMYETVDIRAEAETSPPVVGRIFRMLYLPPVTPAGVTEDVLQTTRERFFKSLREPWDKRCRQVLDGSAGMAEAALIGGDTLRSYARLAAGDAERTGAILQMVVDMLWCSSKAYDKAGASGAVAEANAKLLRSYESLLAPIGERDISPIANALNDPQVLDRGAAVRQAVFTWLDELEDAGVARPDFGEPPTDAGDQ